MEEQQQKRAYALGQPRAIRIVNTDGTVIYVNTHQIVAVEDNGRIEALTYIHLATGKRIETGIPADEVVSLWAG